jgi:CheY-like chemotaxis protein
LSAKTVLLVDDEQGFLEPLEDALSFEGHVVLKATNVSDALGILAARHIDLITIDVMLDPGSRLAEKVGSHTAGLYLCKAVRDRYPRMHAFCISVISDPVMIREIEALGIRFLRKGETPLRTVLNLLRSRLTGIAYSTDRDRHGQAKS